MYEDLKIEITSSGAPAADTDIRSFERDAHVSLPADYRRFLQELNGGIVSPNVFETAAGVDYSCGVNELFGLDRQTGTNDIRKQRAIYVNRLPSALLPVGLAAGGNLICLCVQGSELGTVYFWDHESESSGEALRALTDSFSAFMHSLRPLRADEVKLRKEDVIEAWIDPAFLEQFKNSQ